MASDRDGGVVATGGVRVLGIAGSLRAGSFNRALLHAAMELAPAGMEITEFTRIAEIPHYNADLDGPAAPEPAVALRRAIAEADALLIVTPLAFDRLFLVGYLTPWIIWSTAALGLNFLMGGAGQIHLGYGAIIGIGAYASEHAARAGAPFEIALLAGGLVELPVSW